MSERLQKIRETANTRMQQIKENVMNTIKENIYTEAEKYAEKGITEFVLPLKFFTNEKFDTRAETESFFKKIKDMLDRESIKSMILWDHPDCSYCESCSDACRPSGIKIYIL